MKSATNRLNKAPVSAALASCDECHTSSTLTSAIIAAPSGVIPFHHNRLRTVQCPHLSDLAWRVLEVTLTKNILPPRPRNMTAKRTAESGLESPSKRSVKKVCWETRSCSWFLDVREEWTWLLLY